MGGRVTASDGPEEPLPREWSLSSIDMPMPLIPDALLLIPRRLRTTDAP